MRLNSKVNIYEKWLVVVTSSHYIPNLDITSMHTIQKWLNPLTSHYHAAIIFLAVNNGYVNLGLLKHYGHVNWPQYFKHLVSHKILKKTNLCKKEQEKYFSLTGFGDYQISKTKFYTLTDEAFKFYSNPLNENFLKQCVDIDTLLEIMNDRKEDYENNVNIKEKKEKQAQEKTNLDRIQCMLKMRANGIEVSFEDIKFYEQTLGRKWQR